MFRVAVWNRMFRSCPNHNHEDMVPTLAWEGETPFVPGASEALCSRLAWSKQRVWRVAARLVNLNTSQHMPTQVEFEPEYFHSFQSTGGGARCYHVSACLKSTGQLWCPSTLLSRIWWQSSVQLSPKWALMTIVRVLRFPKSRVGENPPPLFRHFRCHFKQASMHHMHPAGSPGTSRPTAHCHGSPSLDKNQRSIHLWRLTRLHFLKPGCHKRGRQTKIWCKDVFKRHTTVTKLYL